MRRESGIEGGDRGTGEEEPKRPKRQMRRLLIGSVGEARIAIAAKTEREEGARAVMRKAVIATATGGGGERKERSRLRKIRLPAILSIHITPPHLCSRRAKGRRQDM